MMKNKNNINDAAVKFSAIAAANSGNDRNLSVRELSLDELKKTAAGSGGNFPGDEVTGWCWGGCVTPETLFVLADGTEKRVDELRDEDQLMIWDFDRGCLSKAGITFFHRVKEKAKVLRVRFSDGTDVGVVMEHAFFDLTDRRFVAIRSADQAKELTGHRFAKLCGGKLTEVILTGIEEDGMTESYYSPVTEAHFNCFANGLLNISGFMAGLYNVFDLEENALKYNAEKKEAEIRAVGEIPYEVFASVASRELYERNHAGWFSVSIAKGLTTAEELVKLFGFCKPFFVQGKKQSIA